MGITYSSVEVNEHKSAAGIIVLRVGNAYSYKKFGVSRSQDHGMNYSFSIFNLF